MLDKEGIRKSRRQLGELLGLAPCPAPSPRLFMAIVESAPAPRPVPRWRQPRFAFMVTALLMAAAISFHMWHSANDSGELADVDELAEAGSLVL